MSAKKGLLQRIKRSNGDDSELEFRMVGPKNEFGCKIDDTENIKIHINRIEDTEGDIHTFDLGIEASDPDDIKPGYILDDGDFVPFGSGGVDQVEDLDKSSTTPSEDTVGKIVYLTKDVEDGSGEVVNEKGWYKVVEVPPVAPSTESTYVWELIEEGGIRQVTEEKYQEPSEDLEHELIQWIDPDNTDLNMVKDHIYVCQDIADHTLTPDPDPLWAWIDTNREETECAIGEIKAILDKTNIPSGWLLCDGSPVLKSAYSELWQVIGDKYGTAADGYFKLPNLNNRFLQGTATPDAVGNYEEAGLPNITGQVTSTRFGWSAGTDVRYVHTGAFSSSAESAQNSAGYDTAAKGMVINFDASDSPDPGASDVYGNSTTVQPASIKVFFIIRARKANEHTYSENTILGDIRAFATGEIPDGWLVCNGNAYNKDYYKDLYDVIGNKFGTWASGDVDHDGATHADWVGWPKLPDLVNRFVEGGTTDSYGQSISAGLPDIVGDTWIRPNLDKLPAASITGAFYQSSSQNRNPQTAGYSSDASTSTTVAFKASKTPGNTVYGNSNTVQPPAVKLVYCIRAVAHMMQVTKVYSCVDLTEGHGLSWHSSIPAAHRSCFQIGNTVVVSWHCMSSVSSNFTPVSGIPKNIGGRVSQGGSGQQCWVEPNATEVGANSTMHAGQLVYITDSYTAPNDYFPGSASDGDMLRFNGSKGTWETFSNKVDYNQEYNLSGLTTWTAPEDAFINYMWITANGNTAPVVYIDGYAASRSDSSTNGGIVMKVSYCSTYIRKGQVLTCGGSTITGNLHVFKVV